MSLGEHIRSSRDHAGGGSQSGRQPPVWLVPVVVALLVGGATYAWNPELVRSTLTTPRALVFIVVVVALVVGVGRLLGPRRPGLARGLQLVLVLAVLVVTVLPTIRDTEVNEELDVVSTGRAPASASPEGDAMSPSPDAALTVAAQGSLRKLDYRASGRLRLIEAAGDKRIIRFDDLDVQPGPDYVVYLVPKKDAVTPTGGLSLGRLKANKGDQNYPVPASAKLGSELTVLIWCRAFAAPVAHAPLA